MPAMPRADVEVESTVDVEATLLVVEVFVRNRSGSPIRNVRIRPQVHRGDFAPTADAKGIADLPSGRSGRAVFQLEPRGPDRDVIEVSAAVTYLAPRGSRHRRDVPRMRLDLALPALRPLALDAEAFANRASRAFSHAFERPTPSPAGAAVRSTVDALGAFSLAALDAAVPSSEEAATQASLAGVDDRGIGYLVRIVGARRGSGSVVRVTVFAESEVGLFGLHHRVRAAVDAALRSSGWARVGGPHHA